MGIVARIVPVVVTVREAAGILGCPVKQVREYVASGVLRRSSLHRREVMIWRKSLEALIDERNSIPIKNEPPRLGTPNLLIVSLTSRKPPRSVPMVPHKKFFVYSLGWPNKERIFYVGKGTGHRPENHLSEARRDDCQCRKCNIIRTIWRTGRDVRIDYHYQTDDERDAYAQEKKFIAEFGRRFVLCNRNGDFPREPPPPKPFEELTLAEVKEYLEMLGLRPKDYKERLLGWAIDRHQELRREWATCRRQHWHERAAELEAEMDALDPMLGVPNQPRLL
jgi:hypothetical protein